MQNKKYFLEFWHGTCLDLDIIISVASVALAFSVTSVLKYLLTESPAPQAVVAPPKRRTVHPRSGRGLVQPIALREIDVCQL